MMATATTNRRLDVLTGLRQLLRRLEFLPGKRKARQH